MTNSLFSGFRRFMSRTDTLGSAPRRALRSLPERPELDHGPEPGSSPSSGPAFSSSTQNATAMGLALDRGAAGTVGTALGRGIQHFGSVVAPAFLPRPDNATPQRALEVEGGARPRTECAHGEDVEHWTFAAVSPVAHSDPEEAEQARSPEPHRPGGLMPGSGPKLSLAASVALCVQAGSVSRLSRPP